MLLCGQNFERGVNTDFNEWGTTAFVHVGWASIAWRVYLLHGGIELEPSCREGQDQVRQLEWKQDT